MPSPSSWAPLCLLLVLVCALSSSPALAGGPPDACLTTCCAAGWSFYGEGNFSKLGVNGSSNCNCFDAALIACPKSSAGLMSPRALLISKARREMQQLMKPDDGLCQPACCSVGHAYYGYGDYSRLGDCNCVASASVLCGNFAADSYAEEDHVERAREHQHGARSGDRIERQ